MGTGRQNGSRCRRRPRIARASPRRRPPSPTHIVRSKLTDLSFQMRLSEESLRREYSYSYPTVGVIGRFEKAAVVVDSTTSISLTQMSRGRQYASSLGQIIMHSRSDN